ncbi:MAG TPA: hypothetical protein VMV29_11405, partial [Ktedonobacterales bacterium]|nr:hypothetical protein [Ktedonobacterales bacterium]
MSKSDQTKAAKRSANGKSSKAAKNGHNGHDTLAAITSNANGAVTTLNASETGDANDTTDALDVTTAAPAEADFGAQVTRRPRVTRRTTPGDDDTFDFALLKRLSETPGVAGREERVREIVIEALAPLTDELSVDALGNVIAIKRGRAGKGKTAPLR